ncbi:cadherin-23 [Vespula maculifrons]|uniref:Cadherin-23 n=1 Tax=Vespula maculifrons TaxID=7453 RepID=A0ABD2BLH8_VESMC
MTTMKTIGSSSWLIRSYKRSRFKEDWPILLFLLLACVSESCTARNNPPRFLIDGQPEIVLRLKEGPETLIGSLIYRLRGVDPDGDSLTFGVRDQPGSDVIRLENFGLNEANIYLNKLLDREVRDEYALVLTLTDGKLGEGNFITQSLLLLVEDINDNVPIFRPHPTSLTIREDSGPGILTTVEATDADEGAHGQVVYYLQELDGDNDIFGISTVNGKGIVRLLGRLDYERKYLYQLRILAVDRAINEKVNTGTTAILVKVQDVEDQPPEFISMTPVARISENARIGTSVLQVRAADGDKGINNKVTYSITQGPRYLFDIDATSGLVFTRAQLDREAEENIEGTFVLEITVKEVSRIIPPPSVSTEVTVILTDVNDETPTFRSSHYQAEINENSPQNTPVNFIGDAIPEVYDHDLGTNGTFRMFIEGGNGIFDVTPSRGINEVPFIIRVKNSSELDFEKRSVVNFTLIAKEIVSHEPKYSAVPVTIFITDQNDNYPEFTKNIYEVSIEENCPVGSTVAWVQALDEDSGTFGSRGIRYTNLGGSIAHALILDPISGVITVKQTGPSFDRELVSRHYLTIEARDDLGKGNRNTAQLIVNINDVNDNAPVFLQNKYEAVLLENEDHFEAPLVVEAFDIDLNGTKNSDIIYALVSGEFSKNFTIDPKRGIISLVNPLDFEALPINQGHMETSVRHLKLTVRARDMGTPSLSSDAPVIIYLKDVNDNPPSFERTLYKRSIPEDLEGGTSVRAWDKDLSSPNNKIVYRIQNGAGDKFVIGPETGVIRVASGSNLDPDLTSPKTTRYSLNVVAIDSGTEIQRTAEVLVNITIVDVNNKPPLFIDPGTVVIRENTQETFRFCNIDVSCQVGAYVHRVVANDPDIAPILRYRVDHNSSEARNEEGTLIKIQEYDYLAALELNAIDGLLRVVKLLDRERVETIRLGLVVEDLAAVKGLQTASAVLSIIIEDENDNNPKFRRPFYRRSVTENSKNGVNIASIVADDADKNRSITYSLESPKELTDLVHLDPETGEMVVANKIDRELYPWLNLTVRATDSGIPPRSSLSEVYVQVLDENDNNPYFVTEISNITAAENAKIGTEIAIIQARDLDSGDYGKITYLLDRMSSQGKFAIHPETGAVTVADTLDWESRHNYVLVIEAWDNYQFGYTAGESRNAFKQIPVTVIDVNDNSPKIEVPQECVSISEFHDIRDSIVVAKAQDADDPTTPNGRVVIRILSGNEMGLFMLEQVDYWTARIKAVRSLRGKFGNYSLKLEARDLGVPSNKETAILDICVTDYNDNPPIFISPQHNTTIRVSENVTVGTPIIQIVAEDADTGPNGDVHFRLKQDLAGHWRTFHIDDRTGVISLKLPLDRELQRLYEIRVEAYDLGIPTPLSSDLDLIIYVRNINDYEPQFLIDVFNVNFTEEQLPRSEMAMLPETIDRDEVDDLDDPPTQVCYFIVGGNDDGSFTLDVYKHELTTARTLDRETQTQHTLIIKATEDCSTVPTNETIFDETNDTLLKVIVTVGDINDNPPRFVNKVFTGGVTTEADFGTQFMNVKAIDLDAEDNGVVSYYQVGKMHMTLTEGLDDIQLQPFLVHKHTGAVSLNFDPQRGMKGYFDFTVLANDSQGLMDTAKVFIYLLREDQRVRFVLRQHPPEIRNKIEIFRQTLGNVTGAIVNVDEYKIHENHDGSVDRTKTDLYLHLVNRRDNSILEVSEVLELVDRNIEKLDNLFKEFNVLDTQPAQSQPIVQYEQAGTTFWLLTLTLFLGALLILCIALCLSQRASFQRQLKAANASSFGTSDSEFIRGPGRVPNTNKHSMEGSNPIWMHAYENEWFKSDESYSHTSERDSLDENALNNEEMMNEVNTEQRTEDKPYYIEPRVSSVSSSETVTEATTDFNRKSPLYLGSMTTVNPLGKKIETTEL